jgi:hypothetical protein
VYGLTLKRLLAVLITIVCLAAFAPAALSLHWGHGHGHEAGEGHHMMGRMIKSVDIPITVTGTSDNSAAFTVSGMTIEGMKGKTMAVTLDQPLTGKYNMTNDMAYVSTKGVGPMGGAGMTIRVDTANNTTIPVAGASAVLGLGDIRVKYHGKDYAIAEFGKMSVYLPDGTVRNYDLDKPVKVIKSKERKTVIWDAYPDFTRALSDSLKGGTTFPADAAPMKLTDYMASVASSTPMRVSEAEPTEAQPPTT